MNYRRAMCVTDYRGIFAIDRLPGRAWSAAVAALLALSGMLYIENVSMADGPCDQCNGILAEIKTLEKESRKTASGV